MLDCLPGAVPKAGGAASFFFGATVEAALRFAGPGAPPAAVAATSSMGGTGASDGAGPGGASRSSQTWLVTK